MPDTISAEPRWWYWLGLPPAAATVGALGALVVGLSLGALIGFRLAVFLVCFVVFSLVAAFLIGRSDRQRLHYVLTPDDLVLGRGAAEVRIPLADVPRAVMGLPPVQGRGRVSRGPAVLGGSDSGLAVHRLRTLVLVLPDGALLPLSLRRVWLRGGGELTDALTRRLAGRIVGPDSYRPAELALLAKVRVRFNAVLHATARS